MIEEHLNNNILGSISMSRESKRRGLKNNSTKIIIGTTILVAILVLILFLPLTNVSFISFEIDDQPSILQGDRSTSIATKGSIEFNPNFIDQAIIKDSPNFHVRNIFLFSTRKPIVSIWIKANEPIVNGIYDINITLEDLDSCNATKCKSLENIILRSFPGGRHTIKLETNIMKYKRVNVILNIFFEGDELWKSINKIKVERI